MSCWAAGLAMLLSWRLGQAIRPIDVAQRTGRLTQYRTGLDPLDSDLFAELDFAIEAPQTYTADGFLNLLRSYGPLWVAAKVKGPHVRVVTGFEYGSDPYKGTVYINDPIDKYQEFRPGNRGSAYTETYTEFALRNEALGTEELRFKDKGRYFPVYFVHCRNKPA